MDNFLKKHQNKEVNEYQNNVTDEVVVSVCVQTYQHVNFIKDCLDGILIQRSDFPFEILVGEDASTDGTRAVCINYAEKHPDKIKLFLHHRGNNIKINGMPTGRFNFMYNLLNARGKYIALCEGDDYWTDPYKLQKQLDFLDSHPECSICFHNVRVIYEDNPDDSHLYYVQHPNHSFMQKKPEPFSTLADLVKGNFIQTPSVVFRANLFEQLPDWFFSVTIGDWPLHILNAHYGDIGYIDEIMAVYRVHDQSIWSSKKSIYVLESAMDTAILIRKSLNSKNRQAIDKTIFKFYLKILKIILDEQGYEVVKQYFRRRRLPFLLRHEKIIRQEFAHSLYQEAFVLKHINNINSARQELKNAIIIYPPCFFWWKIINLCARLLIGDNRIDQFRDNIIVRRAVKLLNNQKIISRDFYKE